MQTFTLKKKNKHQKILKFNYDDGYQFKPNIKNPNLIPITNLSILDISITNPILNDKIEKSFRELATLILNLLNNEDATSGDVLLALDEVSKQKSTLLIKYKDYLQKEIQDKHLKRLRLLEKELKAKIMYLKTYEETEKIEHSR